jgi:hypothetical protein
MAAKKPELELPCQYNQVSVGEKTASIGVNVDRSSLKVGTAEKHLVGKRLLVKLLGVPRGDLPEQKRMFEDAEELEGVIDVNSFTCKLKQITFKASFKLANIDVKALCGFAKKAGRIDVFSIERIPDDDEDEEDDEDEAEEEEEEAEPKPRRNRGDSDL